MTHTLPPFTDPDVLEDAALLAALDNSSGNLHAPDGDRLCAQGLATVNGSGHYYLTPDGHAAAHQLRDAERDLITDGMLGVINQCTEGRAHAKKSGWIVGVTSLEQRPYLQRVRLPHTSPETFGPASSAWSNLAFQLFSKLDHMHTEFDGDRLLFGALDPRPRANTPRLGQPDEARTRRITARQHANAFWNDLRSGETPVTPLGAHGGSPVGLVFHYASRYVTLSLDPHGRYQAAIQRGPGTGQSWTGHRADIAVKALAMALNGTPCAHDYTTGQDSCPGCDASAERFVNSTRAVAPHASMGPMPGSTPALAPHQELPPS